VKAVFADTFYFLALLNADDVAHLRATEAARNLSGQVVTTSWVLAELANSLSKFPASRLQFLQTFDKMQKNSKMLLLPPSSKQLLAGIDFFRARPDKEWSLTDCISFIVMKERRIKEALTGDHHFEQAGFIALLK
jgi:uncharacterized protein